MRPSATEAPVFHGAAVQEFHRRPSMRYFSGINPRGLKRSTSSSATPMVRSRM